MLLVWLFLRYPIACSLVDFGLEISVVVGSVELFNCLYYTPLLPVLLHSHFYCLCYIPLLLPLLLSLLLNAVNKLGGGYKAASP